MKRKIKNKLEKLKNKCIKNKNTYINFILESEIYNKKYFIESITSLEVETDLTEVQSNLLNIMYAFVPAFLTKDHNASVISILRNIHKNGIEVIEEVIQDSRNKYLERLYREILERENIGDEVAALIQKIENRKIDIEKDFKIYKEIKEREKELKKNRERYERKVIKIYKAGLI